MGVWGARAVKESFTLHNAQAGYQALLQAWQWAKPLLLAGHRLHLSIRTETRTLAQNSLMWSVLEDIARQVEFAVDGRMQKVDAEDVKDILSAGLKKHQRIAAGIEGGFVMLGQRTSKMTIGEMADLITLGHAFGDSKGVQWRRTSLGRDVPDAVFEGASA